jgi:hypothetical protein
VKWGGVDLGGTLGSVKVSPKITKGKIMADQYGTTVLDNRVTGLAVTVETELAETRSLNTWAAIFPSFLLTAGPTGNILAMLQIGRSDRDNAQPLVLHPIVDPDSYTANDFTWYLAYPTEDSQFTYGPSEQVKAKIVWNCYPVLTGSNAPKWGGFGSSL